MQYEFMLIFELPDKQSDPKVHADTLDRAGCADAAACFGIRGHLGLEFRREAMTCSEAKARAVRQVQHAIPGATLMLCED